MSLRLAVVVALAACSSHSPAQTDAPPADVRLDGVAGDGPTSNIAPHLVTSFAGESGASGAHACGRSGGTNCEYRDHADATIASNGTYVVEVTGQSVTVYDATGTQVHQTAIPAFVTGAGGSVPSATGINDPYIDWNEFAGRWVISIPTDKQDFLAVSATNDPAGAWSGAPLTATNTGDITMKLGHDRNGEYIGEFTADGAGVADSNTASFSWYCFAIPTLEMMWSSGFTPAHKNQSNCAYEARPVMDHDPAKATTAPFYFVGKTCPAGSCQNATNFALGLIVHRGTWSGTSIVFDSKGQGGSDRIVSSGFLYNTPIAAAQPSGASVVMIENHRVMGAEQYGSTIYTAIGSGPCASSCGAQGVDAHNLFYYLAVDTQNYPTLALADSAKVSSATVDFGYPAVALDGANVAISTACTSTTQDLGVCAFSHGATDPSGAIAGPVVLYAGTQIYNCNGGATVGTGTYANAVVDGADPSKLWTVQQDAESATSCQWTTRIAQFDLK
jgi:hypothetical protein